MDEVQMREILRTAMDIRFPRRDPNEHPSTKITALEDYLTDTAVYRGELESALYWAREAEKHMQDEWDEINGWEPLVGKRDTDRAVVEAKRRVNPALYRGLRDAKRLIHDIGRQIRRLEKDFEAVSRDYTLLTGS
jgi:hypothetical protein